jgi:hypothetical protein
LALLRASTNKIREEQWSSLQGEWMACLWKGQKPHRDRLQKIAEFFRKAGIPYKLCVQGGKITNFQIEHI